MAISFSVILGFIFRFMSSQVSEWAVSEDVFSQLVNCACSQGA